jgi:hypothetical protein
MTDNFDLEPEFLRIYERCQEKTMTSIERMYALYQATCHIADRGIPGDFVECGVWRGGSVMLIALTLLARGCTGRPIWLYDTFSGMTAPSAHDIQEMSGRPASDILAERERSDSDPFWGIAARSGVERNLQGTGYPADQFRIIEGDVRETIPSQTPSAIALLRLDTDWYETTRHELEHLYPRISRGGIVIVDDYGYWRGSRKATDDYFGAMHDAPLLHRIDFTGRIAVRP